MAGSSPKTDAPRRPDFFRAFDRGPVHVVFRGRDVALRTGHGLFSADRLDDGTRLLLDHLPDVIPARVLDLGCGYGALGLPIAAASPSSTFTLSDRDLVAVRYAERNAALLGLTNVRCAASLGVDALDEPAWDLALCNVPARIGADGITRLIGGCAARLCAAGEVRFVVISDLAPVCESLAFARGGSMRTVARGRRHVVFAIGAISVPPPPPDDYLRDCVALSPELQLDRPHDISEDASHLGEAMPLLLDFLPRALDGKRVLAARLGYGGIAIAAAKRGAEVTATDRDLLQLRYTRRNAEQLGRTVATHAAAWLCDVEGSFDLVALELSSTAGDRAAEAELAHVPALLAPGGFGLVIAPKKELRAPSGLHLARLGERGRWSLFRATPAPTRAGR